jgi:hypothetical protein
MTIRPIIFETANDLLISILSLNWPSRFYRAFSATSICIKRVTIKGTGIAFDAKVGLHLLRAQMLEPKEPEINARQLPTKGSA